MHGISRYGTIAESIPGAGLRELMQSRAWNEADVIVLDSGSSLMPKSLDNHQVIMLMQEMRKKIAEGRTYYSRWILLRLKIRFFMHSARQVKWFLI